MTSDQCVPAPPRHRRRETHRPLYLFVLLGLGVAINIEAWGVSASLAMVTVNLFLGIALVGLLLSGSRAPGPSAEDLPVRRHTSDRGRANPRQ